MQNTQQGSSAQPILLAQANTDPGFKVPGASAPASASSASSAAGKPVDITTPSPAAGSTDGTNGTGANGIEVAPVQGAPASDTSARDQLIAGAVFLVLLLVFFFARNAFSNHLVRRRVAPSSADTSGWLLFCGLGFVSAAVVLAVMNASKFLSGAITGTLLLLGVAALVGAWLTGRR
ncbi:hypothetical protein CSQ96_08685 [Janthinobacterium sp. BJB412]|nr:hypothetical protein CSQ96_08685 [Janthinobacterium sp. BJB412]